MFLIGLKAEILSRKVGDKVLYQFEELCSLRLALRGVITS